MNAPSHRWHGLVRLLGSALEKRSVQYSLGALVLSNTLLLFVLILTEQLRWVSVPWTSGATHALFGAFFATSVFCTVVVGGGSVWGAVYLYRRRGTDPKADAMTILRRAFIVPVTYLLSTLWGGAWLAGRSPRLFGAALVGFFVAHQIVLTVYYTARSTRQSRDANRARAQRNDTSRGGRAPIRHANWRLNTHLMRLPWELSWRLYGRRTLSPLNQALCQAVLQGNANNVQVFLGRGANANVRLMYAMPLLSLSASDGCSEIVRLLLDAGARIDDFSPLTRATALVRAAEKGHEAVLSLLLERGATADAPTRRGHTPLMMAASEGHAGAVRLLLSHGADVNKASVRGMTALMHAARHGDMEMVRSLLDAGADTGARSRGSLSALNWAEREHHDGAATLIRQAAGEAKPHETTE